MKLLKKKKFFSITLITTPTSIDCSPTPNSSFWHTHSVLHTKKNNEKTSIIYSLPIFFAGRMSQQIIIGHGISAVHDKISSR